MKQLPNGIWSDECPDCGWTYGHDDPEAVRAAMERHRCPDRKGKRTNKVTRIGEGAELKLAIDKAWAAQQEALETPEGQEAYRLQQAEEERDKERERLRPFLQRGIPRLAALALVEGKDHHDRPLHATKLDLQLAAVPPHVLLVLVFGRVGTGKTVAASRWLMEQPEGSFIEARDFAALSPKYGPDRERIEGVRAVQTLVVDEVRPKAESTPDERERVGALLQYRFDRGLKTWALANMSPKDFSEYGDRLGRRAHPPNGLQLVAGEVVCPAEQRRLVEQQKQRASARR